MPTQKLEWTRHWDEVPQPGVGVSAQLRDEERRNQRFYPFVIGIWRSPNFPELSDYR